tara:strand:- start:338 stop:1225 length:888 start_codon:yes stop_codon:yes gene_type:complete
MKRTKLVIVLALALSLAGSASAHSPEGWLGFAWQWPAGAEPVIDGNGSEFAAIPAEWWQTTEMFPDTQGGVDINRADFDAKAVITYSRATNFIYAYSEVFDDFSTAADTWQFLVDVDHVGDDVGLRFPEGTTDEDKERLRGSRAQQYEIWNTAGDSDVIGPTETLFFWGKASWLPEQGWYQAEHTFEGTYGGEGTTYLEVLFGSFTNLDQEDPSAAEWYDLDEGIIIGLGYNWMDVEDPAQSANSPWESFYNLTQNNEMFFNGAAASDFLLAEVDPGFTAVEATTWGRVKSQFAE